MKKVILAIAIAMSVLLSATETPPAGHPGGAPEFSSHSIAPDRPASRPGGTPYSIAPAGASGRAPIFIGYIPIEGPGETAPSGGYAGGTPL